uniref:C-type lectin domain-containing protein n=1 Tax=Panagrellus redivivus TaxID=6233 RepID=A0A7E4W253_PANRE
MSYRSILLGIFVFAAIVRQGTSEEEGPECYFVKSRPNQCLYFIDNYEESQCEDEFGGSCYIPQSVDDLKEIRVVMFWKSLNYEKVATGLQFSEDRKVFVPRRITDYWKSEKSNITVAPKDVNYDGSNGKYVVMSWDLEAGKAFTTSVDQLDPSTPMLCQRTARKPRDKPAPGPFGFPLA